MNKKPIGVFDSGLGGLTAVKELRRLLPGEDIVYFGDTAHLPYGSRGRETIVAYTRQDIAFLLSQEVKVVVAACGTASSTFPPAESGALPVPYIDVLAPTADAALAATRNGKIGIIGTEATIASGSYRRMLQSRSADVECFSQACPLFVPLVENGQFSLSDPLPLHAARLYLEPLKEAGIDTLILGCTHYPLLAGVIAREMGEEVTLVDSGRETAHFVRSRLESTGFLNGRENGGTAQYFVSADAARFEHYAELFLGEFAGGPVQQIDIDKYGLPKQG